MLSDCAGDHESSSPHRAPRWAPHTIWSTLHEARKKEAMHALDQKEDRGREMWGGEGQHNRDNTMDGSGTEEGGWRWTCVEGVTWNGAECEC